MSDTPRTDAAEVDGSHFSDWGTGPSGYVFADFSRQLERELAAAIQRAETAETALEAAYITIDTMGREEQ